MNERIKELTEKAGLQVESWMTNPPKPFQILGGVEEFEKFAELIMQECIGVCSKNHRRDIGDDIQSHFGVEQ